jgi:hypothetical protein
MSKTYYKSTPQNAPKTPKTGVFGEFWGVIGRFGAFFGRFWAFDAGPKNAITIF